MLGQGCDVRGSCLRPTVTSTLAYGWSLLGSVCCVTVPSLLQERAQTSEARVQELRKRVAKLAGPKSPEGLAVFCAGSYARLEASKYSDIDLFFVYGPNFGGVGKRTEEIQLFSQLIDIVDDMDFPKFSNDGQYLQTLSCDAVHEHLGSPADDYENLFTMRMLMLLESKCIHNDEIFASVQRSIIDAYYRDYPDHQSSFEPWFLLNDIGRFWKTLLLNYENRRNQRRDEAREDSEEYEIRKNKQKVKNFKLKYSRMTTCFATIGALASHDGPIKQDDVFELVQKTPQERLLVIADLVPSVAGKVDEVLESYAWFLEQTGQSESALLAGFGDKRQRQERFERANAYGDSMFSLLRGIAKVKDPDDERLLRFLVI